MSAPWIRAQCAQLLRQRGHAWLLQGPSGLGQYALAVDLARAWLCDHPSEHGACGTCASCHAVDVRTHADLYVLMPETTLLQREWPLGEKAQAEIDDKKRKPSKEIRVDAMRDAVEFSQRTSARGRGKVVLVYPAERMNAITANALLKTLEEPAGDVRFVIATESAHALLPTIRSRCIGHTMQWPHADVATAWLLEQGIEAQHAASLLQTAGGRPEDALVLAAAGMSPQSWSEFPAAMARGEVTTVREWGLPELLDALQKLSHDVLCLRLGAAPRFFLAPSVSALAAKASVAGVSAWCKQLAQMQKTIEHPFQAGLMQEALVAQAQTALNSKD